MMYFVELTSSQLAQTTGGAAPSDDPSQTAGAAPTEAPAPTPTEAPPKKEKKAGGGEILSQILPIALKAITSMG